MSQKVVAVVVVVNVATVLLHFITRSISQIWKMSWHVGYEYKLYFCLKNSMLQKAACLTKVVKSAKKRLIDP